MACSTVTLAAGLVAAAKLGDVALARDVLGALQHKGAGGAAGAAALAPALRAAAAAGRVAVVALVLSGGAGGVCD